MVKHVVKPLLLRILRESRVPKKSMFTRAFGVFYFLGECSRCPAPKARALPTALHPEVFNFLFDLQLSAALPVATKALTAPMACQSPSCCHSLLLAFSATGGARKRPQLRYIPKYLIFYLICSCLIDRSAITKTL